jgi:hypothetical protein
LKKHIVRSGFELGFSERDEGSRITGLHQVVQKWAARRRPVPVHSQAFLAAARVRRDCKKPGHLSIAGVTTGCGTDITDIIVGAGTRNAVPEIVYRELDRVRGNGKDWDGASVFKAK